MLGNKKTPKLIKKRPFELFIRVGKTGLLGPWLRVIGYCRSVRMLPVIHKGIAGSIDTILQYPKDPVLPTLLFTPWFNEFPIDNPVIFVSWIF